VVADGAAGWPQAAPYDRVHVTCSVRRIPYAWVEQTWPGGVIVLPLAAEFGTGAVTRLDVLDDGTAVGRFVGEAWFMPLRGQRKQLSLQPWESNLDGQRSTTALDPHTLAAIQGGGAGLFLSARLRNVDGLLWAPEPDGSTTYWLLETGDEAQSWAAVDYRPGASEFEVEQYGPRRLWDETHSAYFAWVRHGRPALDRLGVTVDPHDQHFWIDSPTSRIA
jgi:hypothetical protein